MAEGYRARLGGNSVVLRAARRPSSILTAVGAGLEQLGGAAAQAADSNARTKDYVAASEARIAEEEKRRWRSEQLAVGAGDLAERQGLIEKRLIELRQKSPAGGAGHEAAAREIITEELGRFTMGLPDDDELRNRFAPMVTNYAERVASGEFAFETNQRVEHQGESWGKLVDIKRNELRTNPDPALFASSVTELADLINGLDINGNQKEKLLDNARAMLGQDFIGGLTDAGQTDAVRAILKEGTLDAILSPEQKVGLSNLVDAEEGRIQRAADKAASAARDAARDVLDTIKVKIDNGEDVPTSEINAALAGGTDAGLDQSELTEYGYLGADQVVAREARSMPTTELTTEIRTLEDKAKDGELDGRGARRLENYRKVRDARTTKKSSTLKPLLSGTVAERVQGIQELAGMPIAERYSVAHEAGDSQAAVIASLHPRGQMLAVQGGPLRKARPADFLPPKTPAGSGGGIGKLDELLKAYMGPGILRSSGSNYTEIRDTALDIMAATGGEWDEANFYRAVQVVSGGSLRADGVMQGGIRAVQGRKVELPPKWTASEFDSDYSRQSFADARYSDGRPVNPVDVRKHYELRYQSTRADGTTLYRLVGPDDQPLTHKNGGPYALAVAAKPGVAK